MIPKKIHYCWLSGEPIPPQIRQCMETWQRILPEYEQVKWDKEKFDIASVKFVEEACNVKKWAFAADYIRLYALYTEGGIYLDTDVYLMKPMDPFLRHDFFTCIELDIESYQRNDTRDLLHHDGTPKLAGHFIHGIQIQAAVMGSIKGHPFMNDCMKYYHDRHFILDNGSLHNKVIAPQIYARAAVPYGFVYQDKKQELKENMHVYSSEIFAGHLHTSSHKAYAIHMCAGGWRDYENRGIIKNVWESIRSSSILRKLAGKGAIVVNAFSYKLTRQGKVCCKIFSLNRHFLLERTIGDQEAGAYTCQWQDYDMPDGKYICLLMLDDIQLREFVLIKESVVRFD